MNLSKELLDEAKEFYTEYRKYKVTFFNKLDNDVLLSFI